jgi:hypothetical protein
MSRPTVSEAVGRAGEGTVVQPGDTLIVRVDRDAFDPTQAAVLKENLQGRLPGVTVLILAADQMFVYRPDDPTGR